GSEHAMRADTVARRYARALFSLAKADGSLDAVGAALANTTEALTEPRVMRILTGPVPRERKRALLLKIVEMTNAPAMLRDFFLLLADHDRLDHVAPVRAVFDALLDEARGIIRATIRSATPLAADTLEDITHAFSSITGRQVRATVEVVADLI